MIEEVSYQAFKTIVNKWSVPFIYYDTGEDTTLVTANTIPVMRSSIANGSADHADFIANLKTISDNLVLFDINRRPVMSMA